MTTPSSNPTDSTPSYEGPLDGLTVIDLLAGCAMVFMAYIFFGGELHGATKSYLNANHCTEQKVEGLEVHTFECGAPGARYVASAESILATVKAQLQAKAHRTPQNSPPDSASVATTVDKDSQ